MQAVDLHVAVPHKLQLHVYHLGDKPLVEQVCPLWFLTYHQAPFKNHGSNDVWQRELTNRGISAAQLNPPLSDAVPSHLCHHHGHLRFLQWANSQHDLQHDNGLSATFAGGTCSCRSLL